MSSRDFGAAGQSNKATAKRPPVVWLCTPTVPLSTDSLLLLPLAVCAPYTAAILLPETLTARRYLLLDAATTIPAFY